MSRPIDERPARIGLRIGLPIGLTALGLIAVALSTALWITYAQIHAASSDESAVDVTPADLLRAGVIAAAVLIPAVVAVSIWASARAVRPMLRALEMQRRFVADASHELRTPLAVLSTRLQLLQRELPPGVATERIAAVRQDASHLVTIVDAMLSESAGDMYEGRSDVDEVISRLVDRSQVVADPRGIRIRVVGGPVGQSMVPAVVVDRIVSAMLENAVAYTHPRTEVLITIGRDGDDLTVTVNDTGPGLVGITLERVFDRFARGETNRPGTGLGLPLARASARRFGGDVRMISSNAEGTSIRLTLPAAQS